MALIFAKIALMNHKELQTSVTVHACTGTTFISSSRNVVDFRLTINGVEQICSRTCKKHSASICHRGAKIMVMSNTNGRFCIVVNMASVGIGAAERRVDTIGYAKTVAGAIIIQWVISGTVRAKISHRIT